MKRALTVTPNPVARLHLSDVEFRGEVIYFIVLDRFHSGREDNWGERNDLNDPTRQDWHKYWGGDLQGLYDRLDYLQDLGVTAIWVTPLFEQVEAIVFENGQSRAAIHGYWTRDFKRLNSRWVNDPSEIRLFTRDDTIFDRLLAEMHRRGMKFILDFVCNHSSPASDEGKGKLYDDGELIADFDNDTSHWYHHYGEVADWQNEWQVQNCEVAGLATFNENNIEYRRYIKDAARNWLDKGVDALRIDTVKHMPLWFWQEFNSDMQAYKPDVFIFGEWIGNHPLNQQSLQYANLAGMSLLDFGLCHSIRECLAKNASEGFELVQAVLNEDHRYRSANELVTFIDNHDMPRFQSLNGDNGALHLALVLLLTSRGIPCLFYGCEQYLHNDTDGGDDPYNRPMMERWDRTEAFRLVRILNEERSRNPALQWGGHWPLLVEPDVYAYCRRYLDSRCFVLLNRGEAREVTVSGLPFPDGMYRCLLSDRELQIGNGQICIHLGRQEAVVISLQRTAVTGGCIARIQVNGAPTQLGDRLAIIGDCAEFGDWDLREAMELECINSGTWFGEAVFDLSAGEALSYKYVILPADPEKAPYRENRTARWRSVAVSGVTKWRDVWEH